MQHLRSRSRRKLQTALALLGLCILALPASAQKAGDNERLQAEQARSELDANRLEASYNAGAAFVRDAAVDAYLKGIVDRLTTANPDAAAVPIRIHALREALPYAFGLDNGAVYVSTGLIARLRTESQLAGLIATEIAPIVRHDKANNRETTRQRAVRRALPNILLVAATAGIAAFPLTKADADAQRNLDAQLRLDSDKVALRWLQQAGYDTSEVPKGLERLRDALSAEQRSGPTELASATTLNARLDALKQAMSALAAEQTSAPVAPPNVATATPAPATATPGVATATPAPATAMPGVATAAPGVATATDGMASLSRRFALEQVREDMTKSTSAAAVLAVLDRLDREEGPSAQTACLRAEATRRSIMDPARVPEAIRAYETCVGFADAPAVAFRELAFLQRRNGDASGARLNFEKYLTRAPGAVDAPIIRGYMEGL